MSPVPEQPAPARLMVSGRRKDALAWGSSWSSRLPRRLAEGHWYRPHLPVSCHARRRADQRCSNSGLTGQPPAGQPGVAARHQV